MGAIRIQDVAVLPQSALGYARSGQIGPLLSSLSYSVGAGASRREATRIHAGMSQRMRESQWDISITSEDKTVDQMNGKLMCHGTLSAKAISSLQFAHASFLC